MFNPARNEVVAISSRDLAFQCNESKLMDSDLTKCQ